MAKDHNGYQKIGATAVSGYLKQGLAELRAAAPFGDSPIAQPTNYAMPGMATPGEITEARREDSLFPDEESLNGRQALVEVGRGQDRDDPAMDL
ncbi:MAG TPA: hypothetical protein VH088_21445 [Terriglobales bacterium]|jgi:hypothetical protein|nr:hypothetical protein [Terriglobales bacterium]